MKSRKNQQKVSRSRSFGAAAPNEREAFAEILPSFSSTRSVSGVQRSKSEALLKEIRRKTKRIYSAEQKIIIVMEGIRGEVSIAELCRRYGISEATYYKWNKDFVEAGKKRLSGDELRQATSSEVEELRRENKKLKESLADLVTV
jgi:transposase